MMDRGIHPGFHKTVFSGKGHSYLFHPVANRAGPIVMDPEIIQESGNGKHMVFSVIGLDSRMKLEWENARRRITFLSDRSVEDHSL